MNSELVRIVDGLARDKNIDKDLVFEDLEAAMETAIRKRYGPDEDGKKRLRDHLRHLTYHHEDGPMDYIDPGPIEFPDRLPVAFAVCHPECGRAEFVVEGSTQECQSCGGLMFRKETAWYRRESDAEQATLP